MGVYNWTGGGGNNNWSNTGNWDVGGSYPDGPDDTANIQTVFSSVTLDVGATITSGIAALSVQAGNATLTFAQSLQVNGTVTIGTGGPGSGTINMAGFDFTIGALSILGGGTLTTGNGDVICAGNWINIGTFNPGTGKVQLAGTAGAIQLQQNRASAGKFYDLECLVPGKIIQFKESQSIEVDGSLIIQGGQGNEIQLVSQASPTQWGIQNDGNSEDVDFAYIKDSNPVLINDITAENSTDGGNNDLVSPGWIITEFPMIPKQTELNKRRKKIPLINRYSRKN